MSAEALLHDARKALALEHYENCTSLCMTALAVPPADKDESHAAGLRGYDDTIRDIMEECGALQAVAAALEAGRVARDAEDWKSEIAAFRRALAVDLSAWGEEMDEDDAEEAEDGVREAMGALAEAGFAAEEEEKEGRAGGAGAAVEMPASKAEALLATPALVRALDMNTPAVYALLPPTPAPVPEPEPEPVPEPEPEREEEVEQEQQEEEEEQEQQQEQWISFQELASAAGDDALAHLPRPIVHLKVPAADRC